MEKIKLVNTDYKKPEIGIKLVNTDYEKPIESKPIILNKEEFKIANSNKEKVDSLFNNLKTTLKPEENKFTPNIYNSIYLPTLGISIPKVREISKPISTESKEPYDKDKALFNLSAKEEGLTKDETELINSEENYKYVKNNPVLVDKRTKLANNFTKTLNILKDGSYEDVENLLLEKKKNLELREQEQLSNLQFEYPEEQKVTLQSVKLGKPSIENQYWKQRNNIETDFKLSKYELDNLFKDSDLVAEKSAFMHNDPEAALKQNTEQLKKNLTIVGNRVNNIGNPEKRNTFTAFEDTPEIDDYTKDYYALDGINAEVKSSANTIKKLTNSIFEDLQELNDLKQQLQQDPTNTSLVEQIKNIVNTKINPVNNEIKKYKSYIDKLNEVTFSLENVRKDVYKQDKIDADYQELIDKDPSYLSLSDTPERVKKDYLMVSSGVIQHLNPLYKFSVYGGKLLDELEFSIGAQSSTQKNLRDLNFEKGDFELLKTPIQTRGKGLEVITDENGKRKINLDWNSLTPMMIKTTLDMVAMRKIGSYIPSETLAGKIGSLYLGSSVVFGGSILEQELKNGLSLKDALAVTSFRLGAEAVTELANPFEFVDFGKATGILSNLTKKQYLDFVGKNWKTLLPKVKSMGIDIFKFLLYTGKQASFESLEEILSDLGNYGIDLYTLQNIKPDYEVNKPDLNSLATTAITTAITMTPAAIVGAIGEIKADKSMSNLRYSAAQNPDLYLQNLEDSFKRGLIDENYYTQAKEEIETIKSIYEPNKTKIEVLDDNFEKAEYLNLAIEQRDLTKQIANNPDKAEKLLPELEKVTKQLDYYNKKANKILGLSPEEKLKFISNRQFDNLKNFATEENIQSATKEDLQLAQQVLQNVIDNNPNEKFKKEAQLQIDRINNRLIELEKPIEEIQETETKEKSVFEQTKEKINSLSKEELESFKIPTEIKGNERKQIIQAKVEREKQLETEENSVTFKDDKENTKTFQLGDLVSYQGNNYVVKKDENNNPILFNDKTQKQVVPSDVSDFQPYTPKTEEIIAEETVEPQEKLDEIFGKQEPTPTEDIEAKKADIEIGKVGNTEYEVKVDGVYYQNKKLVNPENKTHRQLIEADIERRRPTSYIRDSKDKKSPLETFRNEAKREWDGVSVITGDRMKNLYVGIQLFVEAYPEHKDLLDKFIKKENGTIGITNNNLSFVLNTLKKQGVTTESELGVKINAKYDAELATLEQPKEEIEIHVVSEQDLIAQKELEQLLEQEAQEKLQKEQLQQEKKEIEEKIKYSTYNPLGTIAPIETEGIVGKTSINSLKYLQNEMSNTGKSLSDLGYYITVHSVVDFPKEKYFQQWQKYWAETKTPDDKRNGLVAIITDKEGDIKLFDETGKPSETGIWSIHQVRKNFKQPAEFEGEKLKQWKLDVEKAEKLQKAVKPNSPIVIQSTIKAASPKLSKGVISANYQKGQYSFSIGANSEIKTPNGAFKIFTNKKISDVPNIAEAIYDYLNINNSQGLPDIYVADDLSNKAQVIQVFKNRLSFGEFNPQEKTFPEIFAYTRQSLIFQVNEDGTPYITDKNKPGSYKIEGRDNFVNFLNKEQLNLHKRAEYTTPLDIYYFKDGKFDKQTIDYQDFVANNFETQVSEPVGNPHFVFETAVKKITSEPKDVKIIQEPVLEQPQIPTKKKFDFDNIEESKNTIDDITDSTGLDRFSSLSQKTTKEQETQAKTWFDDYLKNSGVTFEDSRDIANSTAFATWKQGAITLWKSGKYTDLYHEAWHDFTQMFLTIEQKKALYNEAEKSPQGQDAISKLAKKLNKHPQDLNPLQKFYALEEMLAEDFYNYMISGQKLILNQRVKRNTIFRKIYNFLKEILTGKPNIESLYRQLANKNINKAQRDPSNALFGKLNKSIEDLSIQDSLNLYKAIDGIIAQQLNLRGISISRVFLETGYLDKVYGTVKNTLLQSAKELAAKYEENPSSELEYTLNNLQYTLSNWNTVKEAHKNNSNYLKVSKELLPESLETNEDGDEIETNNEKYGDQRDNQNPMDNVSQYILYLVASLPKYTYKNGKPVVKYNDFLPNVQDTVDFGTAWGQLAKTLQGDKDYNSIYKKLEKLAQKQPTFTPLLTALPNPVKDLNRYELQLVASFINALSKPIVNLKTTSIEFKEDGKVVILSRNAEPITIQQLKQDWNLALQELPNEYTKDVEGQKALDVPKILDDFKYLSSKNSQEFLNALGFTFSQGTKDSFEMQDILNLKNNTLKTIYQKLKQYNELSDKKDIIFPVEILSKSIWKDGKSVFEAPKDIIDDLISLELRNSEQYHADSVSNSEGNNQWLHKDWSLQSQDFSLLNNVEKYPTYQDLIANPVLGQYFDISINPDADNLFLHTLFNLDKTSPDYGKRKTIKGGKYATLELFDQNGIRISIGNEREGIKTSRLPRFLALIQDIPSLLTTGEKQHLRYGDKSTSRGTLAKYPSFVKGVSKVNYNIPIDIIDSKFPDKLSNQAWFILRNSLISTLQITNNQTSQGLYNNTANLPTNIKYIPFGKFDKLLSKSTKGLLKASHSEEQINVSNLIDNNTEIIKQDIANYFKEQTQAILKELNDNPTVKPTDYIPERLLKDNSLEELIHSFSLNSWIINSEHERLIFQDSRYYDLKVEREAKRNLREPFKRYSKASSTGTIAANNQQINSFFNNPESNSFAEKAHYDDVNKDNPSLPYTEQGMVNSVIVNDVEFTATDIITDLLKYLKNAPEIEQKAIQKSYTDLTVSDAMAVCTLDFYRNLKLRIGEEGWSDESEKLYQKIARGEKLTKEDENNSFLFFSPLKFRVAGRTYDNSTFTPVDYKFAITPLLPTTMKGKAFETVRNNMIRQNTHLLLFKSASKHSAITNNGKYNNLYNEDGTPFTGEYLINQVPIEYFYEVVNAPESYKEEARYSTQLRTLLFVNLFDNGKPQDYSKSKESWDKLSETEKKKASPSYRRTTEFRDNIDNIVQIRKEKLLKEIGAVQKPDGTYSIDDAKLSNVLEREFERKNLPLNVLKSIQITEDGTFKFPFDATIARDEIENTILSIIDNQLRKQDVYGESLIQVSSAGFEVKQDDTLPFYKDLGRTLPDGTKVTSAHKVKIAIQGDFKKLLQHPDVLSLSAKDKITPLEALNQLIKDESWLNKGDNRQLITITGVRIPVQGLNSQEFMEVHEFLPTESGNIIVVSPALVAKSGGDFDWDKITSYFPHIYIDNNGDVLPVKKLSDSKIEELYNSLSKELKAYLKEFQKEKDKELSPKELQTFLSTNKLISNIFGEDLTSLVFDSFSQNTIPSKNQFVNLYKEKVAHNDNITIMREVLENPNNYVNLLLPNATYMFEDIADERRNAEQKEKPSLSDNYTVTESLNQHESNFVGKDALGIGAIYNKFLPILQQAGAYLNDTYTSNIEFGTTRNTRNRFPHNTTKDGNISVSGVWSVDKPNRGKYKISEAISQLMNGWVDVAKKDWIFYINGRKEFAPTMLFHLMQGTHKDDVIAFFNQPVLYDYMNILSNYRNPLIRATNRAKYNNAKKEAIYQSLMKYLPNDLTITTYKFKKPVTVNVKEELTEKYNGENPAFFYGFVSNELRQLADDNQKFFNSDKFDYYKFAIPEGNKLTKPETNEEKLSQALYLIQFLELEEQTKLFNQMRRTMNNDTSKASSFQYSATRAFEQEITKLHNLFPDNVVDKMINESSIAAFTNQTTGIDKFISQITPELFEITNNPEFNKFLNSEWNKPEKENFIAFSDKDQDTKEAWIKTFKNDFILYLYDNNVFDENDNLVASKVYQQMQYNTALGNEIEAIKREFPVLVKNNLFLNYLIKDNSLKLNSQGKPEKVNIKLKYDKLDKDNSDIMTQDFQKLINFDDPNYTIEQQNRIKTFASNLQDFAYVQSGLNKTPYYISKYIPQDAFAGKIQSVVEKIADIFNNSPEKAQEILKRFNAKFRFNNPKFYTQQYDENGEPIITFNIYEPLRYKPYIDEKLDLFGKKALENAEKLKKKTTIQPSFEANEAKENPTSLFIFGDSKDQKATQNSAKITLSKEGNSFKRTAQENIIGIPVFNTRDSYFNDDQFSENQALIDNAIKQILDKEANYSNIVFSENLFETSKLSETSPNTYNYAVSKLNTIFGTNYQSVEEVIFETEQTIEEPIKIEENIKEGVDFVFEQNPELANAVYESLGFDKTLEFYEGNNLKIDDKTYTISEKISSKELAKRNGLTISSNVPVYIVNEPLGLRKGGYDTVNNIIILSKNSDKETIHHELIHSVEYDLDKKEIEPLYQKVKNIITEDSFNDFVSWNFKKSISEFIADALSKKVFRDALKKEGLLEEIDNILSVYNQQITPQQKQEALQQYSQYLESLNKPNTNPILQGNQNPDVILPIGTSGSGKSTFIKSLPQENLVVIEPDAMRVEFTGNMNDKSKDKEIYIEAAKRAIKAIKQGKQVVFDTTNLTKDKRLPFIEAIKKEIPNANIQYKLMELNPELAKQRIKAQLERGENRAAVSDETIDRHAASYKQMLEDIKSEPISNYDIQQEQVKKFAELQERLNNKEFLEGAKNAYESSKGLQELGTQKEYNDYIARVSLGIIKNPSSGEYNYTSKVKDIVYHGSDNIFEFFDKNLLGKNTQAESAKKGFFFSNNRKTSEDYIEFSPKRLKLEPASTLQGYEGETRLINKYRDKIPNEYIRKDVVYEEGFKEEIEIIKSEHRKDIEDILPGIFKYNVYHDNSERNIGDAFSNPLTYIKRLVTYKEANDFIKDTKKSNEMSKLYMTLLDIKNPLLFSDNSNIQRESSFSERIDKALLNKNDSVIIEDTFDPYPNLADIYVVFEPEQIHILGSKQDIEGFKQFVGKEGYIFPKQNIFTVEPVQSADKKAKIKASIANKYIGFGEGIANSSTELYRKQAGKYANTGIYNPNDVVFVSIGGKRGNEKIRKEQQDKTIREAIVAIEAGATLITDNKFYAENSEYNEGEKRLAKNLEAKGYNYSEQTIDGQIIGIWKKEITKLPPLNPCK